MPTHRSLARLIVQPIAIAILLAAAVRLTLHVYSIPSDSMVPTLAAGDRIIVTPYFGRSPARGDIVVFRSPAHPGELLVKRVIAVPGELIDSSLGRVRIGGHTLTEPYLVRRAATGQIASQIIPAGCFFVLGDNRDDSIDSRFWGAVPESAIVGRARVVVGASGLRPAPVRAAAHTLHAGADRQRRSPLFKWLN